MVGHYQTGSKVLHRLVAERWKRWHAFGRKFHKLMLCSYFSLAKMQKREVNLEFKSGHCNVLATGQLGQMTQQNLCLKFLFSLFLATVMMMSRIGMKVIGSNFHIFIFGRLGL